MMSQSPTQQECQSARAKLMDSNGNPTREHTEYTRYRALYEQSRRRYEVAYTAASAEPATLQAWPMTGLHYHDAIDDAMQKWVAFGFKFEIERALEVYERCRER